MENLSKHEYNHGEGVAIGMNVAAAISVSLELLRPEELKRQQALIEKIGLPGKVPDLDIKEMIEVMHRDKKAENGRIRFVLPTGMGTETVLRYLEEDVIESALRELQ